MSVIEIHTSDRIMFKRCRRKWDLASKMRHGLEPVRVNDKLWLGTGVHYGLMMYYAGKGDLISSFRDWTKSEVMRLEDENNGLWAEQKEMLEEQIALGVGMLQHYLKWSAQRDPLDFVKVIATERKFQVPILSPSGNRVRAVYGGIWDGIVQDSLGLYWLLEHKTASQVDEAKLPLDEQCGSYIWAAEQMFGLKLEGVIYNVMRKKLPVIPEVLKNGGLSKRANMDTTVEVYAEALINYYGGKDNVPWNQYTDILQTLKDKGNTFFTRVKVRRSRHEIKDLQERIYWEYKDMTNPKLVCYPNPTRDCSWDCDFRSVCLAMNDGSDHKYMLETMYRPRREVSLYERLEE